ncbi:ACT domain-containing protein [Haliscomenobacter sp.]|uniref:ACT domain-containing protein n=1 Tax=Haliscomenobacter sp. TaxID=2717303 RepID=UPI003593FE76
MPGEKDLVQLLKTMHPSLNEGEYVFCTVATLNAIPADQILSFFKEAEGFTIILTRALADQWQLEYSFVAAWITLTVHSTLDAVGLTAAFSNALANAGISCNVVAGYYHDHIFVDWKDAERAMAVLWALALT